jgi:hypothetical protein
MTNVNAVQRICSIKAITSTPAYVLSPNIVTIIEVIAINTKQKPVFLITTAVRFELFTVHYQLNIRPNENGIRAITKYTVVITTKITK